MHRLDALGNPALRSTALLVRAEARPVTADEVAAAILIDATLVRGVLLPATMKLLGERNSYLPRWLEWLPRVEAGDGEVAPAVTPAATGA